MAKEEKVNEKKEVKQEKPKEKETKKEKTNKVAELEKKVGEFGDYIGKTKEFIDGASIVIQSIAGDPDLLKRVQSTLKKTAGVGGEEPGGEKEKKQETGDTTDKSAAEVKATVRDVASSQQTKIVQDFESKHGIDKMKKGDRKEARKKIAEFFNQFGLKINTIPLSQLNKNLESAYLATHAEKLKEEGKLEGFTQARGAALGTMQSVPGSTPVTEDHSGDLTDKQKGWTDKLGVDSKKAKKTYQDRGEEQTRVSAAEKKKK